MVIGSDFNMNKTDIHNNDFARRLALKERLSELGNGLLFILGAILIYPTGREELYFVTVRNKYEKIQALKGEINYGYGPAHFSSFFQRKRDKRTAQVGKISVKANEKKTLRTSDLMKFCRPGESSQHRIIAFREEGRFVVSLVS